jgi:hypothetical protein
MKMFDLFNKSVLTSNKIRNYFEIYDEILAPYLNLNVTLVEIGLAEGGSLQMWRNYFSFGNGKCRIIGIEIDPEAKKFEKDGYEIYIGDQADPNFWIKFYSEIGKVDILIADGGHTNLMQTQTLVSSYPHINDGGIIIFEDTHQSFSWTVGNPHFYSFFSFAGLISKSINRKILDNNQSKKGHLQLLASHIYSVRYFQSMIVFYVDRKKAVQSEIITNPAGTANLKKLPNRQSFSIRIRERVNYNKIVRKKIYLTYFLKNFKNRKMFY